MKFKFALFLLFASVSLTFAQRQHGVRPTSTGGPLRFEQAAFDVASYEVNLNVTPRTKSISGLTTMIARTVIPTNVIVLDLDTPYNIENISDGATPLKYERKNGEIWIWFPATKQTGDTFKTVIRYAGNPRVAPRPPWIGGFMWEKTPSGADWVSVAMQNDGADLLFPVKDHPSDKADIVTMNVSVPDPLVAAGPGKFVGVKKLSNGYSTYSWRMTNPIPNYEILFNAAPYRVIKDSVKSITGETIPIEFFILPESYDKGARLIEETKKYNRFYEKYLGPFPWRSQKLGIVETPHLGMEHATLIAYGNKFQYNEHGFDWLMLHEYGHEWWANLVTASDWRDFWIHEGFQSFMDTLYLEHLGKKDAYFTSMKTRAKNTLNLQPVAPREALPAHQVYLLAPDFIKSNGDIYGKGAVLLHTLRYLIGDDAFFRALRRMAYPTEQMERLTDGRQTRLVNTDDFLHIAERESMMDLDWFFEMYLRQPKLPVLRVGPGPCNTSSVGTTRCFTHLQWETPNNMSFQMPIDVVIDGKTQRVAMKDGRALVDAGQGKPVVDPNGWVLKAQ
ncbi:MAG: M1 family metallopeptidase [Acidobacteria bacterium]|nr:M1 family metallopeptidase [Acidobacteriota bacterium]